jgi:hypothetical protein
MNDPAIAETAPDRRVHPPGRDGDQVGASGAGTPATNTWLLGRISHVLSWMCLDEAGHLAVWAAGLGLFSPVNNLSG